MPEETAQKLDQEKVYQILSKGIVLTMENDLKDAIQQQKVKADLIPGHEKKESNKAIFTEKVYFDPFKKNEFKPIQKPTAPIAPQVIEVESEERLLKKRKEICDKVKNQKEALEVFFQRTKAFKEQKNQIEKQEQSAVDASQKHNFEEQRWQLEEKLTKAQDLQWTQEEEIEKSQMALAKVDSDLKIIQNKKDELKKKELENQKSEKAIELLKQEKEILDKSDKVNRKEDFLKVIQEEQNIEEQAKNLEKKILQSFNSQERKKFEQERRVIAQKRQILEKKRWEIEKQAVNQKVAEAGEVEKEIIQRIRLQAKEREQEMIQKQFVQKQVVEERQAMDEEQKQRQEQEARLKAIEKLRQIAQQEQKKLFLGGLKGPLLKEEILKKLTKVSPEEEEQRKDFLSRISQESFGKLRTGPKLLPRQKPKGFEGGVVFHPMIKRASLFEKISIRILIILLIVGVIAGVYFIIKR